MNTKAMLTEDQISTFNRDGVLIIKDFYDIESDIAPIQRGIYDIIGHVFKKNRIPNNRKEFNREHFDVGFQKLISANRSYGGEVYDAIKQIPAFYQLLSNPSHDLIFKQLRNNSIPGIAAGGYGIRIDNPFEDKYRAMWHQEYPSQLRSVDGIVFWSPLVAVTKELGPVKFCLGSHHEGVLPVSVADPEQSGRSGAYALKLHDETSLINKYKEIAPLTEPGDLVLIDFLVLHASGHNVSKRSRWTLQFRYFNFSDPIGLSHGWKGSYAAGVDFCDIHPELLLPFEQGK